MQDDDLADATQQLLSAFDDFMANPNLVAQLSSNDLSSMRTLRDNMDDILDDYRRVVGITEKRPNKPRLVPSGPKKGMLVPVLIASAASLAAPAAIGVGTGTAAESGLGMAIGDVILPVAIFALAVITLPNAGAEMVRVAAEDLRAGLRKLVQRLNELDALNTVMMMTAAVAAKLTTQELLDFLKKILTNSGAVLSGALVILLELAKIFPQCLSNIMRVHDLVKQLARMKTSGPKGSWLAWSTRINALISEINEELPSMFTCISDSR